MKSLHSSSRFRRAALWIVAARLYIFAILYLHLVRPDRSRVRSRVRSGIRSSIGNRCRIRFRVRIRAWFKAG
jgi:hypothetical protein